MASGSESAGRPRWLYPPGGTKDRSGRADNAVVHGAYSSGAVPISRGPLAEDPDEFARTFDGLVEALDPRDALEEHQAEVIASIRIRIGRLARAEAGQLSADGEAAEVGLETKALSLEGYASGLGAMGEILYHPELVEDDDFGSLRLARLLSRDLFGELTFVDGLWGPDHGPDPAGLGWTAIISSLLNGAFGEGVVRRPKPSEDPNLPEYLREVTAAVDPPPSVPASLLKADRVEYAYAWIVSRISQLESDVATLRREALGRAANRSLETFRRTSPLWHLLARELHMATQVYDKLAQRYFRVDDHPIIDVNSIETT